MNRKVIKREYRDQDILSAQDFSREGVLELFSFARRMRGIAKRKARSQVLGGYIMGIFFFEESTRTRLSSEAAFIRLGGNIAGFIDPKYSSMAKDESFEDTIKTVDSYCDIMTIRVTEVGQAAIAAKIAKHPVINGGDGEGEHPTQALLDGFTFQEGARKLSGIDITKQPFTVAMMGDLKYGRTVHSLVPLLLTLCDRPTFRFIAPDFLQLPPSLLRLVKDRGCSFDQTDKFTDGIRGADALYMLRPQIKRMKKANQGEEERWRECEPLYSINRSKIQTHCKPNILITHPLPRNAEISKDVDDLPGAWYLEQQVPNGQVIRMGLNVFILGKEGKFV